MTTKRKIAIALDIETLGLGASAVVTQIAFQAHYADGGLEPITTFDRVLPVQPQLDIKRTMDFSTILWWMTQPDEARATLQESGEGSYEELLAVMLNLSRRITDLRNMADSFEVWARGTDFDVTIVSSLLNACGVSIPWKYNEVRDLRTLMDITGVKTSDVVKPANHIAHNALCDAVFQADCYRVCIRKLEGDA